MSKQKSAHDTTKPEDELLDRLKMIANNILECSSKGDLTFEQLVDKVELSLFWLEQESLESGFQRMDSVIQESLNQINALRSKTCIVPGLSTGLNDLDEVLGGLQPKSLYVIGGRPGMGKTTLALTIMRNVAVNTNEAVGMFSLQLSNLQVATRLLCIEAQLDSHMIQTGQLSKAQYKKLIKVSTKLKATHIYIDDTPLISRSKLRAKARRLRTECNIKLLVIDYLQLIKKFEDSGDGVGEVRKICRMLKLLAVELNIPIIVLSQLSKAADKRENHYPRLSDLPFSELVEKFSDVVMFIYRPWMYSFKESDMGKAEFIIALNQHGPTGIVSTEFVESYCKFESVN